MSIGAEYVCELVDEEATERLAGLLAAHLRASDLLILTGPLGAGKTFLAAALCHGLGLDEEEPVTSPTFTLVHEYPTVPPVCHADLYRLRDAEDVRELGLESRRQEGCLLLVEWGAPYAAVLGGDAIELEFSVFPRSARLCARGGRSTEIVQALLARMERT